MNPNRTQLQKVIEILQDNRAGVIVLPQNTSTDTIAADTALYMGLNQAGKNVTIASENAGDQSIFGADKVQTEIATSGNDLVISFPYAEGTVDKVDYFIQNDRFNVVVVPRAQTPSIDPKEVKFNYAGGSVDFIITLDAPSVRNLGSLYEENQELFKNSKVVNIDRHVSNSFYGTANLINRNASSISELVLFLLQSMNIEISKQMATNLYRGVLDATKNFTSPTVSASTFEASATLLKSGANPGQGEIGNQNQVSTPQTQKPSFERQSMQKISSVERAPATSSFEGADDQGDDEADWLKPKIFKPSEEMM